MTCITLSQIVEPRPNDCAWHSRWLYSEAMVHLGMTKTIVGLAAGVAAMLALGHLATLWAAPTSEPQTGYHWVDTPGKYVELQYGDRPVLRYMCEPYDGSTPERHAQTYKPYYHVFSPDGSRLLTKGDTGGLYPHHRGLFYGFRKVTYDDGKECDVWHCLEKAHQSPERVLSQHASAESANQVVAIDWHGSQGEVFAHEQRSVAVAHKPGGTQIDFASHLETADGKPIHLDGDPQHAGFHFRAAQEVADNTATQTYYLRTDGKGKLDETRNWEEGGDEAMNADCSNRPWDAMCFVLDGKRYTVLYIDHPDNPKPSRYSERDYGRFGSYFVTDVTAEKPLDVRYRVWVQDGEMTVDQCNAKAHEFVDSGVQ
jgi:Family of unknown function (DUF6807)